MPPWEDFDPLLSGSFGIGILVGLIYVIALLKLGRRPELTGFLEIALSMLAIGTAFAIVRLAWFLPTTSITPKGAHFTVTQFDRIYLFAGAVPLVWLAAERIIGRFKQEA
jgi:hypothetical protein